MQAGSGVMIHALVSTPVFRFALFLTILGATSVWLPGMLPP